MTTAGLYLIETNKVESRVLHVLSVTSAAADQTSGVANSLLSKPEVQFFTERKLFLLETKDMAAGSMSSYLFAFRIWTIEHHRNEVMSDRCFWSLSSSLFLQ
ncbi:hypothetical protein AMECASPLE_012461 [Ameca splendens]|uniref:Uncharacterized protein n=1 Tax=Ameca splendens TaxID=208324 RepID=A0ABV1A877_9TELE